VSPALSSIFGIVVMGLSLYVAWSIAYDPTLNLGRLLERSRSSRAQVAKGLLFLILSALFSSSALSILSIPGPLLTALTSNQTRFPTYFTWLVLPSLINLLWLFLAIFLVWFLAGQIRWTFVKEFVPWHPSKLQKLFLYVVMISLLVSILRFGQDTLMQILGSELFNVTSNNQQLVHQYIILFNVLYGLVIVALLWFMRRYDPAARSENKTESTSS